MTAPNRLNLWMAADVGERDLLHPNNGLAIGDFCLVRATHNLYVCTALPLMAPNNSEWRPIAGLPTSGRYALSGTNVGGAGLTVSQLQAFTFRALLDAPPAGVMLTPGVNVDWVTTNVLDWDERGFLVSGQSAMLAAGAVASIEGDYTISY